MTLTHEMLKAFLRLMEVEAPQELLRMESRQEEAFREVIATRQEIDDWKTAYEHLLQKWARYHPVHALNNTAWMVMAMLYGQDNFRKMIYTAVMCGFDMDCNASNAGTVLGIMTTAGSLLSKWTDPLNDTLRSAVDRFGEMRISDLAIRTTALAEKQLHKITNKE